MVSHGVSQSLMVSHGYQESLTVYVRVCMHVCILCVHVCACMHVCILCVHLMCVCVYMYVCMCVCVYVCLCVSVCCTASHVRQTGLRVSGNSGQSVVDGREDFWGGSRDPLRLREAVCLAQLLWLLFTILCVCVCVCV